MKSSPLDLIRVLVGQQVATQVRVSLSVSAAAEARAKLWSIVKHQVWFLVATPVDAQVESSVT